MLFEKRPLLILFADETANEQGKCHLISTHQHKTGVEDIVAFSEKSQITTSHCPWICLFQCAEAYTVALRPQDYYFSLASFF